MEDIAWLAGIVRFGETYARICGEWRYARFGMAWHTGLGASGRN